MSDFSGRLYNVAKAYLNAAKDRLSEIDAQAQEELSRSLTRDDVPGQAPVSSPPSAAYNPDPMERARAKIGAAQSRATTMRDLQPPMEGPVPAENQALAAPIQTAYKILGIELGADYAAVEAAVARLRERCDPARFPDGSEEQTEARTILQKVEEAHSLLRVALDPGAGRFDKLEI